MCVSRLTRPAATSPTTRRVRLSTTRSAAIGGANAAYIDKAFVQFAGFTAGRVQSFFDFYADNYNFEGIANSDVSTEVFAYTATFGGGFSATISVEEADNRIDGIRNTFGVAAVGAPGPGGTGITNVNDG